MSFRPYLYFKTLKQNTSNVNLADLQYHVVLSGILLGMISLALPINGYLLVIIGLCVDIVGAIFIISPLVNQYSTYNRLAFFKKSLLSSKTIDNLQQTNIINSQNKGRLGLIILVEGFVLQIFGNYFQYLSTI